MIINCFLAIILGVQKNLGECITFVSFALALDASACMIVAQFFSIFLFDILYFDCLSFGKQTNNKFRGNMFFNVSQTNFYKVYVRNLICKNIYKISKWRSKISKAFDRSEFINTRKKDPCRPERMETFSVYYLTK